jgi:gliding motility-associated-like protein
MPVTEKIMAANAGSYPAGYVDAVCAGKERALYYVNGESGYTYNWRIPELNLAFLDTNTVEIDWNVPGGDYLIEIQKVSAEGCFGLIRDTLVLVSQPEPDLGGDISICEGESHTFALEDDYTSYLWQDESVLPAFTSSATGIVYVRVVDDYMCIGYDTAMLTVNLNPMVDLGKDTILCGDNPLVLDAGNFEIYHWSTGAVTNPVNVYEGAGEISVTVTDENGCSANDEIIIGECNPEEILGEIPNTITPNGDGIHDKWKIEMLQLFPDAEIQIFDRWGRLVYQFQGAYANDWDGKGMNGNDLPVDTYYYVIDLHMKDSRPVTGTVIIIR